MDLGWPALCGAMPGTYSVSAAHNRSTVFMANMSVGEAILQSVPVMFRAGEQHGRLQVQAQPQLLCTGEVETVTASAGVFPSNLSYMATDKQRVYHPRGKLLTCRAGRDGGRSECAAQALSLRSVLESSGFSSCNQHAHSETSLSRRQEGVRRAAGCSRCVGSSRRR